MATDAARTQLTTDEICSRHAITRRTLHYYIRFGLLASPRRRGAGTRYDAEHDARLRAIRALAASGASLATIKRKLRGATPTALEAMASSAAGKGAPGSLPELGPAGDVQAPVGEAWSRVVLVPGLELHVAASAPALVRRLAQQIRDHFAIG